MLITRRMMMAGLGASVATPMALRAMAATQISFGGMTVTSLSDGNLVLPAEFFFDGLPQEELKTILQHHGLVGAQLEPPCNLTLLQSGARMVLFDAGSGASFMPSAGALPDTLDAAGIAPDDITDVVFTHAHPDHIWGVLDDFDDPVFPQATHWIGQAEHNYWTDPNTVSSIGEARASFAVGAQRRLEAIADQLSFFGPEEELIPGVYSIPTYGHTPGHMSFELRAGTQALMVGGDAIGNHHVAFARPAWHSGADQNPEQAALTRQILLNRLADEQMPLLGFHLPQGGLGRVEKAADSFRFVPEDGS